MTSFNQYCEYLDTRTKPGAAGAGQEMRMAPKEAWSIVKSKFGA